VRVAVVAEAIETETLARVYLKQGAPARAAAIFERLLKLDPDNPSLAVGLAECRVALKNREARDGMDTERKLIILQDLLARLLGEAVSPVLNEAEPEPKPQVAAMALEDLTDEATAVEAEEPVAVMSKLEQKLQLLQSMLARLLGEKITDISG